MSWGKSKFFMNDSLMRLKGNLWPLRNQFNFPLPTEVFSNYLPYRIVLCTECCTSIYRLQLSSATKSVARWHRERASGCVCVWGVMRKAFEGVFEAAFAIAIIIIIYSVYSSASPHPSTQPYVLTSGKRIFERKRERERKSSNWKRKSGKSRARITTYQSSFSQRLS